MLQTEDATSLHSEFGNTSDCVGEIWGRPPHSCLVSQVFPGRRKSANYLPCPGGGNRCYLHFQHAPRLSPAARNGRHWGTHRMAPRRSGVLQKEDGTSPHSEFRNMADCVGEVWGRPPRSCLVSQVFPGRGKSANYLPCPGGGTRCYLHFQPNPRLSPAARTGRHSGKTREGLLGDPGCSRQMTEPPHTQNSGRRLTVWGRFGAALHAADWCHRCSLAGGSPLITSPVQGEAQDATCISSPTPAFPLQPALGGTRVRHAKGS